jgi:photosystem II stability/assembly factor-like uncharacterized protein
MLNFNILEVHMKKIFVLFFIFYAVILNAQNFTSLNNDLTEGLSLYSIVMKGTDMFIGTNDGVYMSESQSSDWVAVNTDIEGIDVYSLSISGSIIYAGTYNGVFSSSDNGESWNDLNENIDNSITVYDIMANGSVLLAACDYGLYRSSNKGVDWKNIATFESTEVQCLTMKKSGSTTYIFAGTLDLGIYRSSNNGSTWTSVNDGETLSGEDCITSIFAADDGSIYAGDSYGYLFKSSDNGKNWIPLDDNSDVSGYVNKFAYNSSTNELFVGVDDNCIYKSVNGGKTWESCCDEVLTGDMSVKALLVSNQELYVGSLDYGIYTSKLPIKPVDVEELSIKNEINIFPNPSSSQTNISYTTYGNSMVKITITNSLGNEVDTMFEGYLNEGEHHATLNADKYPTGIYYCTLNSGSNKITKCFVVVR